MLLGALAMLVTEQISPLEALKSINPDVILFLFGTFVIGQALEESGYLSHLSHQFFRKAKSLDNLILIILFGMGTLSAFLMNDTLAIIGTPVVLLLARKNDIQPKILLLALAFAVTIGSVMSHIGNPQNLLIAVNGRVTNPFITFFTFLLVPTMVNLFLAYLLLRFFYRKHFRHQSLADSDEFIRDRRLATLAKVSLVILLSLVIVKIVIVLIGFNIDFRLTYIALASSLPIILLSPRRFRIVRKIDWYTLIFLPQCLS
jgi:Na+/H+ antiporter NhaD/arsenite permease-like protein